MYKIYETLSEKNNKIYIGSIESIALFSAEYFISKTKEARNNMRQDFY